MLRNKRNLVEFHWIKFNFLSFQFNSNPVSCNCCLIPLPFPSSNWNCWVHSRIDREPGPQYVRRAVCQTGLSAVRGLHGVLALFLFTIYTAYFTHYSTNSFMQKFFDGSGIVGPITDGNDREYRELTQDQVDWNQKNYLWINTGKNKTRNWW